MAIVVGIGSSKGGVGKTSTANALMCMMAYHSDFMFENIVGIDADPNRSWTIKRDREYRNLDFLVQQGEMSQEEADLKKENMFPIYTEDISTLFRRKSQYSKYADLLFLDLPGGTAGIGVKETYALLDYLIVPSSLSNDDWDVTKEFVDQLEEIQEFRKTRGIEPLKIIGVFNMVMKNTALYTERKEQLMLDGFKHEFGFEFCRNVVNEAKSTYGMYANTYELVSNGNGQPVNLDVYREILERVGIIDIADAEGELETNNEIER